MPRPKQIAWFLLAAAAAGVVWVGDALLPRGRALLRRINTVGPLGRLHGWLGRQPPVRALLMFLVPEAVSRSGFAASAWLLIQGEARQAAIVYAVTKLFAGMTALWVYGACEPALMRVPWFARIYDAGRRVRDAAMAQLRRKTPGRFAAAMAAVRARNAASGRARATPSPPTARGPRA